MGLFDPIDWDGDGEHTLFDDMLEFAIYQDCMKEDNTDEDDNDHDEEEW